MAILEHQVDVEAAMCAAEDEIEEGSALTMTERALLPCPFCGSMPHVTRRIDEDLWTHNVVEWTRVSCMNCDVGFSWPPDAEPDAIDQWNIRAPVSHGECADKEG